MKTDKQPLCSMIVGETIVFGAGDKITLSRNDEVTVVDKKGSSQTFYVEQPIKRAGYLILRTKRNSTSNFGKRLALIWKILPK